MSTTVFINFSHNFPISNINDGAYTVHAKSWQLLEIHSLSLGYMFCFFSVKTYLEQLCPRLFASPRSPSHWKKNSSCVHWETGGSHCWLVCVSGKDVLLCVCVPCAQPLHISAHYSPRGESSERHRFIAHTATHAFPCQQTELTLSLISLMISIPTYFFSMTWSGWFCCFTRHSVFALPVTERLYKFNDVRCLQSKLKDHLQYDSIADVNRGWFPHK